MPAAGAAMMWLAANESDRLHASWHKTRPISTIVLLQAETFAIGDRVSCIASYDDTERASALLQPANDEA